jgi:Ribonuclease D
LKKTKGIKKLKNMQLRTAILISKWREEKAANKDIPRKWLIDDHEIISIAKKEHLSPETMQDLISSNRLKKEEIIELNHFLENSEENTPSSGGLNRGIRIKDDDMSAVSNYLESRSIELQISKDILGSKKDMHDFIANRGGKLNKGWRRKLMLKDLEDLLN